jgi:AcrR family transcriptional regulator
METQERIVEKAHELFMRYGIRSVSMDEIAAHLGMSKKTIYQFYSDKDALVESVINIVIGENKNVCFKQASVCKDAIHEIFLGMDHVAEMLANMNPLLMNDLEKYHHSTFKKLTEHKNKFFANLVKENLERGISEGFYREEIDTEILSQFRVATTFLIFDSNTFPHGKHAPLQILEEITDNFLYGITNAKGQKLTQKYKQQRLKTESV